MTKNAFVTLVTNDDYAMAARALVRSLTLTDTSADIVVMHTKALSESALQPLKELGAITIAVDHLPCSDAFNERHQKKKIHENAPFLKGDKPLFHTPLDNFIKLRLWQFVQYETVVFIDADALAIRNIDKLFAYPEFSAAPNVYETVADFHRLNSGVFVAKPSQATFDHMMTVLDAPDAYWRRTDQTFLETYFNDWHGLPVFFNMLQYVWFNMPDLWDWKSVHIVHYQYEKPWEKNHGKADNLQPLIDLWQAYYDGIDLPVIDSLPNPSDIK